MNKIKIIVLIFLINISASCFSETGIDYTKFHQSDCNVAKDYIFVETAYYDLKVQKLIRRSFQFGKDGMVIRTYEAYYAPDYTDIEYLGYKHNYNSDGEGMLSARVGGFPSKTEKLGMVNANCIEVLKAYFHKNKIKVNIRDIP